MRCCDCWFSERTLSSGLGLYISAVAVFLISQNNITNNRSILDRIQVREQRIGIIRVNRPCIVLGGSHSNPGIYAIGNILDALENEVATELRLDGCRYWLKAIVVVVAVVFADLLVE